MSKTYHCGIVGLPNVGKSTLFNLITNSEQAKSENYPFCTIEPNEATVFYLDERVDKLSNITGSAKKIYSPVKIVDIAGLVEGASKGEGLGNQFLHNIRETDCIIHVVRCYENSDVIHVMDDVNPIRDLEIIFTELRLADMETIDKMKNKFKKDPQMYTKLENVEKLINAENMNIKEDLPLLCCKPFIVLGNGENNKYVEIMKEYCNKHNLIFINFDFNNKNSEDLNNLLKHIFQILNVIFFFTSGKQETRSWAILNGTNAKDAAAEIHTDISKNFIKVEIYNYSDIITGNKPRVRQEGKEYIIKDGDIALFKHNG